ncbi:MAG: hypothetical protein Q7T82_06035 [Armatimonadota bacterium]|nr:hypothetical protein [Armatimonadota bacterium]
MEWPKSRLPSLRWFEYSLHWESLALWDPSCRETEAQLFNPTRESVEQRILPEKDAAVNAAARDLRDVKRLVDGIPSPAPPERLQKLMTYFRRELAMNRALRHYTAAFFFAKLATGGDAQAKTDALAEVAELLRIAGQLEANPDLGFWILEPSRLRLAVREVEEVIKTKRWPAEEAIRKWNEQLELWGYEIP